jgi:hypothetical protein
LMWLCCWLRAKRAKKLRFLLIAREASEIFEILGVSRVKFGPKCLKLGCKFWCLNFEKLAPPALRQDWNFRGAGGKSSAPPVLGEWARKHWKIRTVHRDQIPPEFCSGGWYFIFVESSETVLLHLYVKNENNTLAWMPHIFSIQSQFFPRECRTFRINPEISRERLCWILYQI